MLLQKREYRSQSEYEKPEMSAPGKVIVQALTVINDPIKTLMMYYARVILVDSKMSVHL